MIRLKDSLNAAPLMAPLIAALAFLVAASLAAAPASAAEPGAEQEAPTVGLGAKLQVTSVGAPTVGFGGLGALAGLGGLAAQTPMSGLLVPIRMGESLRLEPHISAGFTSSSSTRPTSEGVNAETSGDRWAIDAGVAAHHLWSVSDTTLGYVGLQAGLGYGRATTERERGDGEVDEYETSSRALYAGPVLGGEYQPTETFGFGVEAALQVRYTSSDNGNLSQLSDSESSSVGLQSHGNIFARVYLW